MSELRSFGGEKGFQLSGKNVEWYLHLSQVNWSPVPNTLYNVALCGR